MLEEQNSVIVSLNPVGIQDVHAASDRLDQIRLHSQNLDIFRESCVLCKNTPKVKRILWLLRSKGALIIAMSINVPTLYLLNFP